MSKPASGGVFPATWRNLYLSRQSRSGTIRQRNRISGHRPISGQGENAMKIRNILAAAGLAVAALGASSGATAQTYGGGDRHYDRDHRSDRRDDRRDDRRHDRYDRNDRGRH